MKIIGLTGPSGAGKGFCSPIFAEFNIPCIDTDDVYHKLLTPPSPCVDELCSRFGKSILNEQKGVDRKKLASVVFSDETKKSLNDLNSITHKFVLRKSREIIERYKVSGVSAVVIDAPLLFESEFDKDCDFTISVLAESSTRLNRIIARDNLTKDAALMRIKAQKPDEFYVSRSNYVLYNDSSCDSLRTKLTEILRKESVI